MIPRESFCRGNSDVFGQRLQLPPQGCRLELLATAYADTQSVATTASADASPAALWSSRERRKDGGSGHVPVLRRNRGEAKRGRNPAGPRLSRRGTELAPLGGGADSPPPIEGGLRGAVSPQQGQCYDAIYRQR